MLVIKRKEYWWGGRVDAKLRRAWLDGNSHYNYPFRIEGYHTNLRDSEFKNIFMVLEEVKGCVSD